MQELAHVRNKIWNDMDDKCIKWQARSQFIEGRFYFFLSSSFFLIDCCIVSMTFFYSQEKQLMRQYLKDDEKVLPLLLLFLEKLAPLILGHYAIEKRTIFIQQLYHVRFWLKINIWKEKRKWSHLHLDINIFNGKWVVFLA